MRKLTKNLLERKLIKSLTIRVSVQFKGSPGKRNTCARILGASRVELLANILKIERHRDQTRLYFIWFIIIKNDQHHVIRYNSTVCFSPAEQVFFFKKSDCQLVMRRLFINDSKRIHNI